MNEETQGQNSNISLIDLFAILWNRRKIIIAITVTAAVCVVLYSIISLLLPPEISPLPNKYTPEALMLIDNKSSSGGGLSSMMNSMGGLASLAGVNMPVSANYSDLAVYLVGTNSLLDSVSDNFNLVEYYKIKKYPREDTREKLKKYLKAAYDDKSGVLAVSFTDKNPVLARNVVNFCTAYLERRFDELGVDKNKIEKENLEINIAATLADVEFLQEETRKLEQSVASVSRPERYPAISRDINRIALELTAKQQVYTQLKVQYEMLKVSMASEKPVFQLLEAAEVPAKKSEPSRGMLCIIVIFAAGFFAVFLVFVLESIANIKNDPEAMAKLKGKS